MALSSEQIKQQSLNAYGQWSEQWRTHAMIHFKEKHKSLNDFRNVGVGKACLVIANGYSLEEHIESIKEHREWVDIFVCDKALGHLIDNGITPDYLMVCDANVSYEKYMKPWEDKLKDVILFCNACGNPKWTEGNKFKDVYFYVNQDIIKSEREFSFLSNCPNQIPAATNVSNAMIVFLTQCSNESRNNFFGYDKYLLSGFDYSWRPGGHYYAFDKDGGGKENYMKHNHVLSHDGHQIYTSNNLMFSAKWLEQYVRAFQLPVVQCGKKVLFQSNSQGDIDEQMQYVYRREDSKIVRRAFKEIEKLDFKKQQIVDKLTSISRDHYKNMIQTI